MHVRDFATTIALPQFRVMPRYKLALEHNFATPISAKSDRSRPNPKLPRSDPLPLDSDDGHCFLLLTRIWLVRVGPATRYSIRLQTLRHQSAGSPGYRSDPARPFLLATSRLQPDHRQPSPFHYPLA